MKTTVFILLAIIGTCFGLATITVGDFINTPVWQRGSWPIVYGIANFFDAEFVNGVGIILNDQSPVLVFRNNDGTYSTVEPPLVCKFMAPDFGTSRPRAATNGKIFICHNTVFEIDGSRNIINVQSSDFDSYTSRVMSDDTIVWKKPYDDGYLYTYAKVAGEWQQVASQDVNMDFGFSIHENWMVFYQSSGSTYITTRQQDYSWSVTASFPTNSMFLEKDYLVYTGGDSVVTSSQLSVLSGPHKLSNGSRVTSIEYGFNGADAWVPTTNITIETLGSDLKPSGGFGAGLLYINNNTIIVSAPFDNYNMTRVQHGGSAFLMQKQADKTWQVTAKFVQATDDARLHQAVSYDNGRVYFFACRTGYGDGNVKRARSECGFKYAEWPQVS